jgi:hypothetical protein
MRTPDGFQVELWILGSGFLWLHTGLSDSASGYCGCASGYRISELTVFCQDTTSSTCCMYAPVLRDESHCVRIAAMVLTSEDMRSTKANYNCTAPQVPLLTTTSIMSSKRRKKISPNARLASDSEAQTGAPAHVPTGDLLALICSTAHTARYLDAATSTKKSGACTNCCGRKIRCEFANEGDDACIKCTQGGDMCIAQESRTRPAQGRSVPPANPPLSQESHVHNTTSMTRICSSRKRSGSQVPCLPPSQPSKQQRRSGSQERVVVAPSWSSGGPTRNSSLDPILEIGDDQDDFDIDSDMSNESLKHGANNFMSALSAGEFQLEDGFYGEPYEDVHYGLDDDIASGRSGDDSDETEDEITQYLHTKGPSKPAAQRAPIKQKQVKSTGKKKSTTESAISQDPQTCCKSRFRKWY